MDLMKKRNKNPPFFNRKIYTLASFVYFPGQYLPCSTGSYVGWAKKKLVLEISNQRQLEDGKTPSASTSTKEPGADIFRDWDWEGIARWVECWIVDDLLLVGDDAANWDESYSKWFPELSSSKHFYSTKLQFKITKALQIFPELKYPVIVRIVSIWLSSSKHPQQSHYLEEVVWKHKITERLNKTPLS